MRYINLNTRKHLETLDKIKFLTKTRCPLTVAARGPPESPWHVPRFPAPLVQMVELTITLEPKVDAQTAFVITGKVT